MANFHERLNVALGPHGYNASLRRSLQSVVLFEAKRCLDKFEASRTEQQLPFLRTFQRKAILWKLAVAISASTHLQPRQREEIFWRTRTSKQPLGDDNAWKRAKMIEKDLSKLANDIRPYQADGRSSDEAVDLYIQGLFAATGTKEEPKDFLRWAYSHNYCVLCYRMFYKNGVLDPSLPPARSPVPIEIPIGRKEWSDIKPPPAQSNIPVKADIEPPPAQSKIPVKADIGPSPAQSNIPVKASIAEKSSTKKPDHVNVTALNAAAVAQDSELAVEKRRVALHEVREHLELLKEFEGVVPEDELKKRKRALFLALPDAPPPFERNAKVFE